MAFWALGKVKNITEKLNLKDYGSKIIHNYMGKESEGQEFFDLVDDKGVHERK